MTSLTVEASCIAPSRQTDVARKTRNLIDLFPMLLTPHRNFLFSSLYGVNFYNVFSCSIEMTLILMIWLRPRSGDTLAHIKTWTRPDQHGKVFRTDSSPCGATLILNAYFYPLSFRFIFGHTALQVFPSTRRAFWFPWWKNAVVAPVFCK